MLIGEFKQEIMRINNKVNLGLYGQGLAWQKVEILQDKVLIIANNKRLHALSAIDQKDNLTTTLIDYGLLVEYKRRLKQELESNIKLKVLAVMKDYDPATEIAFTFIIFEKPVEKFLEENNNFLDKKKEF